MERAAAESGGTTGLPEHHWDVLLEKIASQRCTPFVGAAASWPTLPLGGDVAERWADRFGYPLGDRRDLARVAQFLASTRGDSTWPKLTMCNELRAALEGGPPDFTADDDPHGALASLPLPVYLTTNYDDFVFEALKAHEGKDPERAICAWHRALERIPGVFDAGSTYVPTTERPVVYHLHGHHATAQSLVLTENDFIDFLVAMGRKEELLPARIQEAIGESSLLFVGYRLADWTFRVIHRGLVTVNPSVRELGVTVQLAENVGAAEREYLDRYFGDLNVSVYWGTAKQFARELRDRWDRYAAAH